MNYGHVKLLELKPFEVVSMQPWFPTVTCCPRHKEYILGQA